ncbi:MAG: MarR family transcriptional regulator [Bacteroidetes bacterium]|nr:MarR family transcriptional regulator [Bacteroidota bacterium]
MLSQKKKVSLSQVVLFQIEQASKQAKLYSQREFDRQGLGITVDQWVLLKIIQEAGSLSQQELAQRSLRDPASITRTLDLLVKRQFVFRQPDPQDRRQFQIGLTKPGYEFVERHMTMVDDHRRRSIAGMSKEEVQTLLTLLKTVQRNMAT